VGGDLTLADAGLQLEAAIGSLLRTSYSSRIVRFGQLDLAKEASGQKSFVHKATSALSLQSRLLLINTSNVILWLDADDVAVVWCGLRVCASSGHLS
jgi:hypothetical protein